MFTRVLVGGVDLWLSSTGLRDRRLEVVANDDVRHCNQRTRTAQYERWIQSGSFATNAPRRRLAFEPPRQSGQNLSLRATDPAWRQILMVGPALVNNTLSPAICVRLVQISARASFAIPEAVAELAEPEQLEDCLVHTLRAGLWSVALAFEREMVVAQSGSAFASINCKLGNTAYQRASSMSSGVASVSFKAEVLIRVVTPIPSICT